MLPTHKEQSPVPQVFKAQRRVEFAETDMAGIVHFANFFRYMEMTEHALFRSVGLSVSMHIEDAEIGWPRVSASCDYKSPLRFEQEFEVHLQISEIRRRAVVYQHRFVRIENNQEIEIAVGTVTAVCAVRNPETGTLRSIEIPPMVLQRLAAFAPPTGE
jgi:YbgC/YbaW family acyl-CoA thioester hydrolase